MRHARLSLILVLLLCSYVAAQSNQQRLLDAYVAQRDQIRRVLADNDKQMYEALKKGDTRLLAQLDNYEKQLRKNLELFDANIAALKGQMPKQKANTNPQSVGDLDPDTLSGEWVDDQGRITELNISDKGVVEIIGPTSMELSVYGKTLTMNFGRHPQAIAMFDPNKIKFRVMKHELRPSVDAGGELTPAVISALKNDPNYLGYLWIIEPGPDEDKLLLTIYTNVLVIEDGRLVRYMQDREFRQIILTRKEGRTIRIGAIEINSDPWKQAVKHTEHEIYSLELGLKALRTCRKSIAKAILD